MTSLRVRLEVDELEPLEVLFPDVVVFVKRLASSDAVDADILVVVAALEVLAALTEVSRVVGRTVLVKSEFDTTAT
jgi:hypothetical protein